MSHKEQKKHPLKTIILCLISGALAMEYHHQTMPENKVTVIYVDGIKETPQPNAKTSTPAPAPAEPAPAPTPEPEPEPAPAATSVAEFLDYMQEIRKNVDEINYETTVLEKIKQSPKEPNTPTAPATVPEEKIEVYNEKNELAEVITPKAEVEESTDAKVEAAVRERIENDIIKSGEQGEEMPVVLIPGLQQPATPELPTEEPVIEPVVESPSEPVVEPVFEPVAEPVIEPVSESPAESTPEPSSATPAEAPAEATPEPSTETPDESPDEAPTDLLAEAPTINLIDESIPPEHAPLLIDTPIPPIE